MKKTKWIPVLIIVPAIVVVGLIIYYLLSLIFMWGTSYSVDEKNSVVHIKKSENVLTFTGGSISADEMILPANHVKSQDYYVYYDTDYYERKNWKEFTAIIKYTSGDVTVCIPFSEDSKKSAEEKFVNNGNIRTEQINKSNVKYAYGNNEDNTYIYSAGFGHSTMKYYVYSQNELLLKETVKNIINN